MASVSNGSTSDDPMILDLHGDNHILVQNNTSLESVETHYIAEIDRKISDIEESLGNRRYDSIIRAFLSCAPNFKVNHAVSSLSKVITQQYKQIHDCKLELEQAHSEIGQYKDKVMSLSGLVNTFILELSMNKSLNAKVQSDLAHAQSTMNRLMAENEKLKAERRTSEVTHTQSITHDDTQLIKTPSPNESTHCLQNSIYVTPENETTSDNGNVSKSLFNNDEHIVALKTEMNEIQATNKALLTTISRQETRLKNEYIRQQKLESIVHALQSQLQDMKETRQLEDQLKVAILEELSRYDGTKSSISLDPTWSMEDRVKILESALQEEKLSSCQLRQQLETATRYLREVTNTKSPDSVTSPNKITYHRTVFMKSMLPSSRPGTEKPEERSCNESYSNQ